MPEHPAAARFRALYAACGLPEPAVVVEPDAKSYLKSAAALSSNDIGHQGFWKFALLNGPPTLSGTLVLVVLLVTVFPPTDPAFDPSRSAASCAVLIKAAAALFSLWAAPVLVSRLRARARRRGLAALAALAGWSEGGAIRNGTVFAGTAAALAGPLSAGMHAHLGPAPEAPPARQGWFMLDGCMRIGRTAVLHPAPAPGLNVPARRGAPGGGTPSEVVSLAWAASDLVDEAVMLDGLVLALERGAARPPRWTSMSSFLVRPLPRGPAWDGEPRLPDAVGQGRALVLLARASLRGGPAECEAMVRFLGPDAVVRALGLASAREDGCGRLYRFRPDLAMARVEDEVRGPGGAPLVHWMTVPPWILTPREAVAWSFGLGAADYAPTAES